MEMVTKLDENYARTQEAIGRKNLEMFAPKFKKTITITKRIKKPSCRLPLPVR